MTTHLHMPNWRNLGHASACTLMGLVLLLAGTGCGTAPGVVFEDSQTGAAWPSPPDEARVRYIGQLRSEGDLAAGRSGLEQLGDTLFGKKAVAGMVNPIAVCTDGGTRVFVADSGAQCVHVLDLKSRAYARWTLEGTAQRLLQPVGLCFSADGRLLVSDSQAGQVLAIDAEGRLSGVLGRGSLRRPCGLAVQAATGRVYVVDAAAHQVVVLNADGSEDTRIGERGGGAGQFNYPTNVAITADGTLYVSDSLNFRVQVFDAEHRFVRTIGRKGDMPGYFAQPKGLALDSEGHLYVVDAHFEAVQVFDTGGQLLMSFGGEGHKPGEFWLPAGMAIDQTDRIWIADSQNKRVQVFQYLSEGIKR